MALCARNLSAAIQGLVAELQHIEIALADTADLAAIQSFYSSVGYSAGLNADDRILVASQARSIVAAVRLCDEEGFLVLRGMYVAEERRGQGLGSRLLESASSAIGSSECWCVPYTSLRDFYSRIGFQKSESIPAFLMARCERYTESGQLVTVMQRPEGETNS